jgi:hypothetical protein
MRQILWGTTIAIATVLAGGCSSGEAPTGGGTGGTAGAGGIAATGGSGGTTNHTGGAATGGGGSGGGDAAVGGGSGLGGGSTSGGDAAVDGGSGLGGAGGTGGVLCPPCARPPRDDCVGSGPCGCGPYTCPGGAADAGDAGASTCAVVSGEYGDCAAIVGWGFDGTVCRQYSGCGCGPDCDHVFSSAAQCAASCAKDGHCKEDALTGGGIAAGFVKASFCDEVFACGASAIEADLNQIVPLSSACEQTPRCALATCPTSLTGTIEGQAWQNVCAASLLPGVTITCLVWGP